MLCGVGVFVCCLYIILKFGIIITIEYLTF